MTPFDAALSRLREAATSSTCAAALSPESAALRTRRTAVFSADLTDLLRRRAASLVRMRLIWDLILATPDCLHFVGGIIPVCPRRSPAHTIFEVTSLAGGCPKLRGCPRRHGSAALDPRCPERRSAV